MTRRQVSLALLFASALCAADDLPKGEAILDKYIEATGGKAAYAKLKSDIASGTMTFAAMGLTGKMVVYSQAPDKRTAEVTLEGIGKIVEGSNGEIAWSFNAMQGPRLKEGDEKAQTLAQAKYGADANWRDVYKSAETQGVETVDGKECYKVLLTPKTGKPQTRWYDKDTGLLVKMALTVESPMGAVTVETFPSDYRKEGEIMVPHKSVNKMASQEFSMTIDKVEQNVAIPAEKLEPPAEVKALMNKGAAAPAAPAKK
jgi:outer membrane lipoprotein-sorting protein